MKVIVNKGVENMVSAFNLYKCMKGSGTEFSDFFYFKIIKF